ncbi:PREDICTED: uncharacterized protein LOC104755840 [Camelina sativa]|uniref:Uncharacterized protein LOC104755840 n=1 Tax=Camelina sativa TaxID=90675 RepID=A0ABM1R8G3_CAMSA|nr:PREDICTED: uncharacterized protein LOC104755840 [Camelina sativa]
MLYLAGCLASSCCSSFTKATTSSTLVLDVQKLSAEMGLSCITTCKLDALKSVCLPNTVNDSTTLVNSDNSSSMTSHSELPSNEAMTSSVTSGRSEADKSCEEFAKTEQPIGGDKVSQADIRKNKGRLKNGRGITQCQGGSAGKSQGFAPNSFDRVLLDAPCSALGLRPRLFAGLETVISLRNHGWYQRKMFDQAVELVNLRWWNSGILNMRPTNLKYDVLSHIESMLRQLKI